MGRSKFQKAKGRAESGSYLQLWHQVLRSPRFAALPAQAVKALCGLLAQYRGNNNGDLTAALSIMQPYGWSSRDTLKRALDDLLAAGFIIVTRQGGPRISSSWLAKFARLTLFGGVRRDIELDYGRGMTTVTLVHSIAELKPIGLEGVRILGVALRCLHCKFEWRADLDPFGEVVTETARCPRCA